MDADVTDLPMHWKQLYRNLRLQGPAFQYLHQPHGSLVSPEVFNRFLDPLQRLIYLYSLRNIGSFGPDQGTLCRLTMYVLLEIRYVPYLARQS